MKEPHSSKSPQTVRDISLGARTWRDGFVGVPPPREAREGTEKPASPWHLGAPHPQRPGHPPCLPSSASGTSDLECPNPTVIPRLSGAPITPSRDVQHPWEGRDVDPRLLPQSGNTQRAQGPRHTGSRARVPARSRQLLRALPTLLLTTPPAPPPPPLL